MGLCVFLLVYNRQNPSIVNFTKIIQKSFCFINGIEKSIIQKSNEKFISREQAVKIVEDFCANPKGVMVTSVPEEDKVWKKKRFYCIDVVFGWAPAQEFYVDSTNGDIYNAFGGRGLSEDNKPLNRNK